MVRRRDPGGIRMGIFDFLKGNKKEEEEEERDLEAEVRKVYEFCRQDGRPFTYKEVARIVEIDEDDAKDLVQKVVSGGLDRGLLADQQATAPRPTRNPEKEFLRIYRLLKKRGQNPTYEAIARELKITPNEAKKIAAGIQAKKKTQP